MKSPLLRQLQLSQPQKHQASHHDTLTTQQSHADPIQPHITQHQHQIILLSPHKASAHQQLSSEILGNILHFILHRI